MNVAGRPLGDKDRKGTGWRDRGRTHRGAQYDERSYEFSVLVLRREVCGDLLSSSGTISVCMSLCNSWRGENQNLPSSKIVKIAVFLSYRPFVASFQGSKTSIYLAYQSFSISSY